MMARRTRRMSSSLLPLNMTPAMTSIHPPLWWNGPLGPLISGRDLYVVVLPWVVLRRCGFADRVVRSGAVGRSRRAVVRRDRSHDRGDHPVRGLRDLRDLRDLLS